MFKSQSMIKSCSASLHSPPQLHREVLYPQSLTPPHTHPPLPHCSPTPTIATSASHPPQPVLKVEIIRWGGPGPGKKVSESPTGGWGGRGADGNLMTTCTTTPIASILAVNKWAILGIHACKIAYNAVSALYALKYGMSFFKPAGARRGPKMRCRGPCPPGHFSSQRCRGPKVRCRGWAPAHFNPCPQPSQSSYHRLHGGNPSCSGYARISQRLQPNLARVPPAGATPQAYKDSIKP